MASPRNVANIYAANPITTIGTTDLVYIGAGGATDAAMVGSVFKAGAWATGTWPINISGNAATVTNGLSNVLNSGNIFVGNLSNVATGVALSGDATLANTGAITFDTVNTNVGTFQGITINAKGLVTGATNQGYITGNQTITLSGDITGSGATAITATLPTVNSNVGTFNSVTVNAKGQVTSASNTALSLNTYVTAVDLLGDNLPTIYNNGSSGVGATLTYSTTGAQTLDGQPVTAGNNYLIVDAGISAYNGIYTCTTTPATGVAGVLTRATTYNTPTQMLDTNFIIPTAGSQEGLIFQLATIGSITIGTTGLGYYVFIVNAAAANGTIGNLIQYAGRGLYGNSINLNNSSVNDYGILYYNNANQINSTNSPISTGRALLSNTSGAPTFSPYTFPLSALTANGLLFASSTSSINQITSVNSAVLSTNSAGVPSLNTTLPSGLTIPQPKIVGQTSGTSVAAGNVGEYIYSNVTGSAAVMASNGNTFNITSISLTPGVWDLWGFGSSLCGTTSTVTSQVVFGTSNSSATLNGPGPVNTGTYVNINTPTYANAQYGLAIPAVQVNISTTTTYYLVANIGFSVSTMYGFGFICAERRA